MEEKRIFVYMRNSRGAHLFISNSIRIFARIKLDPLFFFFFKYPANLILVKEIFSYNFSSSIRKLKNYNGDK